MLKKSLIAHPQYGNIEITRNPRARRIILRARPNLLCITLPTFATTKELERALEMHGKKLLEQQDAIQPKTIDASYRIDTPQFAFELQPHNGDKFLIKLSNLKEACFLEPKQDNFCNINACFVYAYYKKNGNRCIFRPFGIAKFKFCFTINMLSKK